MDISRRSLLGAFGLVTLGGLAAGCGSGSGASSTTPSTTSGASLTFDATTYTEKTATVTTAAGSKDVAYRLYSKIPYVAKPVDADYQSLSIAVPTTIAGTAVDASRAPILFEIPVGGYLSAKTPDDPLAGGGPPAGGAAPSGALPTGAGSTGQNVAEAIAAGWVVVSVGARGRDNKAADGTYFGKAPAVIVDLKAAVRYLRSNAGKVPGDTDRIVSDGTSAGGAVSTLLGASGDSPLYAQALADLGAADASDAIFAVAAYCPITDLENADKAYEFLYGSLPVNGKAVDRAVSTELADAFPAYQASLRLTGPDGAPLTAERYRDHLLATYLQPAATTYLAALSDADRATYLGTNGWITWSGQQATFTVADWLTHVGSRKKTEPAFDAFDLSAGENVEFGTASTDARHFTEYSRGKDTSGAGGAGLDPDIPGLLQVMNPMTFVAQKNPKRARNWFLRVGTSDTDTSLTVLGNLAAAFHRLGDEVDALMYWDAGHGANEDPGTFLAWANRVTGHAA